MIQRTLIPRLPSGVPPALAMRAGMLLVAAVLAVKGWLLLDARWDNIGATMRWYGASTFFLLLAAMPWPSREGLRAVGARIGGFWARHRWEVVAFGAIFGLGIFMRVHDFGYFPPSGGLAFEEAETGGDAYSTINYGYRPEPVQFIVTNYTAVLGFSLFGYDITALRLPFLIIGILSLVPLYLLLRFLVSTPAALFALTLFAVNRWHAVASRFADETFLGTGLVILAALLLVVVMRTGNPLALIGLGLSTGAIVYEHPSYRHVAFLIVGWLVLTVALRAGREVWVRRKPPMAVLADAARKWWLVAIFAIALAMAVSLLVVSSLHGDRVFAEGIQRHTDFREQTGPFGLLPEGWPTRLKWVAEVMLPLGPIDYADHAPLNLPGERMLDPVAASLGLVAMAYAILTLHKPYRLFFAAWLLVGLFVGAVIPVEFQAAKLSGLLPALLVLIAFLIEDFIRVVPRGVPRLTSQLVLVPLVVWAFVVNFDVFVRQADHPGVREHFNNSWVNICRFVKDLGSDTCAYIWSESVPTDWLFGRSDLEWVCRDIRGQSLNSPVEVWPLESGPYRQVAIVYHRVGESEPDPVRHLTGVYPTIDGPTKAWSPFGSETLEAFVLSEDDIADRQGLYAAYYSDATSAGSPLARRLDSADVFARGGQIEWPAGSTRVQWEGLVLARWSAEMALAAEAGAPLEVSIDGRPVYQSDGVAERVSPADLEGGWHVLQVELEHTEAARAPRLRWVTGAGVETVPVREPDLFAVSPVRGWTHVRSVRVGEERVTWQRIDPYPVFGWSPVWLPDWLREDHDPAAPRTGALLREEWRTDWNVPATREYGLKLSVRSGRVMLSVDGALVAYLASEPGGLATTEEEVALEAGEHRLELIFESDGEGSVGVRLEIGDAGGGEGDLSPP